MFLLRFFFRSLPRIAAGKMYVLLRFLRVSVENSREAMCFLVGSRSDCGMIFFFALGLLLLDSLGGVIF